MTTFSAISVIIAKDIRRYLRNGSLLTFGLLLPLGIAFFFSMLLGDGASQRNPSVYAVVNADTGDLGSEFVNGVLRPLEGRGVLRLAETGSTEEARDMIAGRQARAALLIPQDFTEALETGQGTVLTVVGDANFPLEAQIAREVANTYSAEHLRLRLAVAAGFDGVPPPEDAQALLEEAAAAPTPLSVVQENGVQNRELDTATYYSASMAYFFVFFAAMISVIGIFEEKSGGTLSRLRAAPVPASAVIAGKLASGLLIGLASMAILALVTSSVFGTDWGHPAGVAALIITGVVAAVGLTAAVAGTSGSGEEATNRISVMAMLMGVLGGALFPVSQLNSLSFLSYLTPHRWFMEGVSDLSADGPAAVILPCTVLLCIGAAGLSIAMSRMERMVNS